MTAVVPVAELPPVPVPGAPANTTGGVPDSHYRSGRPRRRGDCPLCGGLEVRLDAGGLLTAHYSAAPGSGFLCSGRPS